MQPVVLEELQLEYPGVRMLNVLSDCGPLVYGEPPFIRWKVLFQSSSARKPLCTPLTWTNAETTCPLALVKVQGGPGETHPGGVDEDGVNHLLVLSGP
jgi:hypothetical protein